MLYIHEASLSLHVYLFFVYCKSLLPLPDVHHCLCTKSNLKVLCTLDIFYHTFSPGVFVSPTKRWLSWHICNFCSCFSVSLWHLSPCLSYKNHSVFYSLPIITLCVKILEFYCQLLEREIRFTLLSGNFKNMATAREMHRKFRCRFKPNITDNLGLHGKE